MDLPERGPREIAADIKRGADEDARRADRYWGHNRWLWIGSSVGSIVGGAGAAVSGLTGSATVAGGFGVAAAVGAGIQTAFQPNTTRDVHRRKWAACNRLTQDIEIVVAQREPTEKELRDWTGRLERIRSD